MLPLLYSKQVRELPSLGWLTHATTELWGFLRIVCIIDMYKHTSTCLCRILKKESIANTITQSQTRKYLTMGCLNFEPLTTLASRKTTDNIRITVLKDLISVALSASPKFTYRIHNIIMVPHLFVQSRFFTTTLLFYYCSLFCSVKIVWISDALIVVPTRRQQQSSSWFGASTKYHRSSPGRSSETSRNHIASNSITVAVSLKNNYNNDDELEYEYDDNNNVDFLKRRNIITNTFNIAAITVAMTTNVASSLAAEPVQAKDTDSVKAIFQRKLRPKPPKVLRRKLSQDFAVLLMRSSYNALDEMDCIAMDQFQRDFFLIRVSEYQTYTRNLGAGMVQQGDLTDPYYFDFISYAQYKTINREITNDPLFVFEEQQVPPEGSSEESTDSRGYARFIPVVVKRDPNLTNDMLIPTHSKKVGSTILDKLQETFGNTDSKIQNLGNRPDSGTLLLGIRQIVTLFLINGYAFKGEVVVESNDGDKSSRGKSLFAKYVITLNAPVTLWGGKALQLEGDPLDNDFILKTITEYIRRSGYSNIKSSIKVDGSTEEITITVNN